MWFFSERDVQPICFCSSLFSSSGFLNSFRILLQYTPPTHKLWSWEKRNFPGSSHEAAILVPYKPCLESYLVVSLELLCFPGGSDCRESACNVADLGSIPGSGRSPREWNGYPVQYSCLENPMDRRAWRATDHGVTKSRT